MRRLRFDGETCPSLNRFKVQQLKKFKPLTLKRLKSRESFNRSGGLIL
jgi:hypothetical protein